MRIPVPAEGYPRFLRTPVLHDSLLPPTLRRNPDPRPVSRANVYDQKLLREAWAWKEISEHGGIKSACRIPELGSPVYDQPPWIVMPNNAREFRQMFSLLTTGFQSGGLFTGADTLLQDSYGNSFWQVPFGWDGVINRFVNGFTGQGWDEFSGNIVWRLKVGLTYQKGLGKLINTYGSMQTPILSPAAGIRLVSGQSVQIFGNIPVGSPVNGGRVTAGIFGWIYPRR